MEEVDESLFDVKSVGNGMLEIFPYYKDQPGPNYLSAPGVGVSPTGELASRRYS